jgi:hypothetical protein
MCGAIDCPSCGPAQGYSKYYNPDDAYDEDDPKHSRYREVEEDRRDYERDNKRGMRL